MEKTANRIISVYMVTLMLFMWIITGGLAFIMIRFVLMSLGFISKN